MSPQDSGTSLQQIGYHRAVTWLYRPPVPIKSDPSTWTDIRQRRGLQGEELAKEYLEARGWQVLEHRFRMGRLEIDIIAKRKAMVAFVEVKTRFSKRFGSPLEAVTYAKQREIVRVASAWIDRHPLPGVTYRFDVIGVMFEKGRPHIEHVQDAFWAG